MTKPLTPAMKRAMEAYQTNGVTALSGVDPRTRRALEARALIPRESVGEIVGRPRTNRMTVNWRDAGFSITPTRDPGQSDYQFWDMMWRGQAKGYELAGLLLKPLASKIAAWTMGTPPRFRSKKARTQSLFNEWWAKNLPNIIRGVEHSVIKGDAYLVVNPPNARGELTLTLLPPEVVTAVVDENDYSKRIGWRIVEVHPHPTRIADSMTVEDIYTTTERIRRVWKSGMAVKEERFPNLTGLVPVIKISNDRGADEEFGRSGAEALLTLFKMYHDVLKAGLEGNLKQGRPTPVLEKMGTQKQIDDWWEAFGSKQSRELDDGTTETYYVLDLSSDDAITLGGDATFRYAQPMSFSADTVALLGLLFYLYIQHTEMPEFIMGNAIASSKASAETQMPAFAKFIEKKQGECLHWMNDLAQVVIAFFSLYERGVTANDDLQTTFVPLTSQDGRLTLDAIKMGLDFGLLDDETALQFMPLDIENPEQIILKARQEAEEKRLAARQARMQDDIEVSPVVDPRNPNPAESAPAQRTLSESKHNGAMLAFMLDGTAASALASAVEMAGIPAADRLPTDELHLTLAYLGDTSELSFEESDVMQVLGDFAGTEFNLKGKLSGIGRFTNVEGPEATVVYASVDAPALPAFRQALVEALGDNGIDHARNHGFTPHISLMYLKPDVATPNIELPDLEMVFDRITLMWGDNRTDFNLKGEQLEMTPA